MELRKAILIDKRRCRKQCDVKHITLAAVYIDTSSIAPTFNGVVFAAHAGAAEANPDLRGVK